MDKRRCWLLIMLLTAFRVYSQNADPVLSPPDTAAITSGDSLSIFMLIDSLLSLDDDIGSQLALRAGYNSNVLSAGRTLGIENFGLAPGISYYHKTGLYADVSGFWSKDFEPSYYLTVASLGYMKDITRRISIMAGYDRYFYHLNDNYIPYKNTLSVTPILDLKPVSLSANYSFYFGEQSVHRIMPGISFMLETKKLLKFDRVAITPSFFMLMGNEVLTHFEYVLPPTRLERLRNIRDYGSPYNITQVNENVFGIMNYAVSIPLNIMHKKWGLSFTYTYNIPKALPGEPATLSESTYLSGSLMYIIDLKRKHNTL